MKKFYVREIQDAQSDRTPTFLYASTLSGAKRKATYRQSFQGTIMSLEDEYGQLLAVKEGSKWSNVGRTDNSRPHFVYRIINGRGVTLCFERGITSNDALDFARCIRGFKDAYAAQLINI